jgi:hypothetical protein
MEQAHHDDQRRLKRAGKVGGLCRDPDHVAVEGPDYEAIR